MFDFSDDAKGEFRRRAKVEASCDPQPRIARSRAGSAQTGVPIFSLPFDRSVAPQHDADSMRIRRSALSWREIRHSTVLSRYEVCNASGKLTRGSAETEAQIEEYLAAWE